MKDKYVQILISDVTCAKCYCIQTHIDVFGAHQQFICVKCGGKRYSVNENLKKYNEIRVIDNGKAGNA